MDVATAPPRAPTPETGDLSWAEVHRALLPLMRADGRTSALCIAREYACLAMALGAGAWAWGAWASGVLATWAYVPCALLLMAFIAAVQHRLSGLAHEASHYILFRDPLANELASDLLLMFPLMALTQKYRAAHFGHHQHVNDPERDPDWLRLAGFEPMRFPIAKRRFWLRYVLRGLWPPAILGYLLGRAKAANLGDAGAAKPLRAPYRASVAKRLRGAYWLGVLTAVHALGAWPSFWLFWVAPLLTFYPLFMLLREIAHHANAPDDGDLTNSRLFEVHPLLAWAVFPYGQAFHLTHHLFALIPHQRMPEAHATLCRYAPYRTRVVVCRGYFFRRLGTAGPSVLDVLARPAAIASVHGGPHARLAARDDASLTPIPAHAGASPGRASSRC
jgi:fatty acid desaturase